MNEDKKPAIDVANDAMSHLVNVSPHGDEAFAERVSKWHRTLQQNFTRYCVAWLRHLSKVQHCDGRNEDSVKLAKAVMEKVDEEDFILPFI